MTTTVKLIYMSITSHSSFLDLWLFFGVVRTLKNSSLSLFSLAWYQLYAKADFTRKSCVTAALPGFSSKQNRLEKEKAKEIVFLRCCQKISFSVSFVQISPSFTSELKSWPVHGVAKSRTHLCNWTTTTKPWPVIGLSCRICNPLPKDKSEAKFSKTHGWVKGVGTQMKLR